LKGSDQYSLATSSRRNLFFVSIFAPEAPGNPTKVAAPKGELADDRSFTLLRARDYKEKFAKPFGEGKK
jgi:hypothetical protein